MRLVGRFDFLGGSGHLRGQHGIVGIIPVDELPGETFYARETPATLGEVEIGYWFPDPVSRPRFQDRLRPLR